MKVVMQGYLNRWGKYKLDMNNVHTNEKRKFLSFLTHVINVNYVLHCKHLSAG